MPQKMLILGSRNFSRSIENDKASNFHIDLSGTILSVFFEQTLKYLEIALLRQASCNSSYCSRMIATEDEWLPFHSNQFDSALSCLNSHWIENLEGKLQKTCLN